ncbi:MAG: phosphoribosyl-AMP cyclohydrolase [Alphaproteobacteria bacterium]|nr:MAG: phosphoribosyl-AMP cyclohydrolase [Alphaproteobacteria bacterium]
MDRKTREEGRIFAPRWTAEGLIPAIAQDHASGRVLMMAWMNEEALARTLETGEAHYWSRSRQRLWRKGESSGAVQRVLDIRVDCDQDCLLLLVEQAGQGACHTGRPSCFYRRLLRDEDGSAPLLAFLAQDGQSDG